MGAGVSLCAKEGFEYLGYQIMSLGVRQSGEGLPAVAAFDKRRRMGAASFVLASSRSSTRRWIRIFLRNVPRAARFGMNNHMMSTREVVDTLHASLCNCRRCRRSEPERLVQHPAWVPHPATSFIQASEQPKIN